MIRFELSSEDAQELAATIESVLSDLSYEIANTDSLDFRQRLKQRKAALSRVLEGLGVSRQQV